MILLDTHIWFWWVQDEQRLSPTLMERLDTEEKSGLAISIVSCWEIAKLVENKRLDVFMPIDVWLHVATQYPGLRVLPLSVDIIVDSARLPRPFHRDPFDQVIVATSRVMGLPLATMDRAIALYPHADSVSGG